MALRATELNLITTYLHMTDPSQFRPAFARTTPGRTLMLSQMKAIDVGFYRFLYNSVGEQWCWRDRRLMSDRELRTILANPCTSVHVLYVNGVPAGYAELSARGRETEIAYFGLRPQYIGQGLGKHLLSCAIARAWDDGAERIWLHTCNLDSPHALSNYLKRGFQIYDVREEPMPERYA
ncbi:MAG: GNAT family N-acetyltransferase [Chloroflexota bacterium]